jgi:hypothetical protein
MKNHDYVKLRNLNLEVVLTSLYNAVEIVNKRSRSTRHYLLQSNAKIAITGYKWIDNTTGIGGGGAIDLVMYIDSLSLSNAAQKLESISNYITLSNNIITNIDNNFDIPQPYDNTWNIVNHYLTKIRLLPDFLVTSLHNKLLLWSDKHCNCVFPRDLGTGAFLRGTMDGKPFKLTIGKNGRPYHIPGDNLVIITEAPIDAISLKYFYPTATILATGGHIGFDKIEPYLANAFKVLLAQDNDKSGDQQANKIKSLIKNKAERLLPIYSFKDWNESLQYNQINNINTDRLF